MDTHNAIIVFQGKNIRRTWHNNEWWFSVFDIISVLTNSSDSKQYVKKLRNRDPVLNAKWGTICTPLELIAPDGKKRNQQIPWRDIIDTRNVFSHQYFGISTQIVWNVCKKDLPTLKKQMQDLLNY